jgi:hypothetical protein
VADPLIEALFPYTPMRGGSQKGSRIIGDACPERREHDRYVLWWDTVVEAEQTWHGEVCGTCRDWRE